jgi:hypothetical protein
MSMMSSPRSLSNLLSNRLLRLLLSSSSSLYFSLFLHLFLLPSVLELNCLIIDDVIVMEGALKRDLFEEDEMHSPPNSRQ